MTKSQLIEESKKDFDYSFPFQLWHEGGLVSKNQYIKDFWAEKMSLIYDKAVEEMREKIEKYPEKLRSIMPEGKLPFVVFQGKATEEEKWVIYSQAFKDILSTLTPKGEK